MDKTYKISQVTEAKGGDIVIDNSLSTTSTNPVQNKVITNKLITKQDKLIAGDNITIEGNVISSVGSSSGGVSKDYVDRQDALKQDKLTAGDNITIIDNVISATGGGGTIPPEQLEQIETNKNDIADLKLNKQNALTELQISNINSIPTLETNISNKQDKLTTQQITNISKIPTLETSVANKQNKLSAGNGIGITSDNTIYSKVKFYNTMPSTSSLRAGDVILVPSEDIELLLTKGY